MKKIAVVLILLAVICVSAFQWLPVKRKIPLLWIRQRLPPMGFQDKDGKDVFDLDLAKAVFDEMGKKVEFRVIDWKLKETLLNSKEIDVIWNGYTITNERKELVNFSIPYMKNSQCVVVKSDDTVNTIEGIKDYAIVVQSGSSAIQAMYENEFLQDSIKRTQTNDDNENPLYIYWPKSDSNVSGADTNVLCLQAVENGGSSFRYGLCSCNYLINTSENKENSDH